MWNCRSAGKNGIILLDTTGSRYAIERVMQEVRKAIPRKPLKAVIITHFHAGETNFHNHTCWIKIINCLKLTGSCIVLPSCLNNVL